MVNEDSATRMLQLFCSLRESLFSQKEGEKSLMDVNLMCIVDDVD